MSRSSPPGGRTRSLTPSYRIDPDTHERFKRIAEQQGATQSSLVGLLVRQYVAEHEEGVA